MKRKKRIVNTDDIVSRFDTLPATKSYRDLGYNQFLEKEEVVKEREKSRKKLMEQEEHEAKMLVFNKQLSKTSVNKSQINNKLLIYKNGKVSYFSPSGDKYQYKFRRRSNSVLLLKYLALRSGELIDSDKLVKHLNPTKSSSMGPTPDRRIRDLVKYARDKLGLTSKNSLFVVDKGYFGLTCDVELIG